MDMAAELIEVQASRAAEVGTPYPPTPSGSRSSRPSSPTSRPNDQVTAAEDIKADMQKPARWTACSAATSATARRDGDARRVQGRRVRQAGAVLVPTTVLAEQHYRSFKERMANYPFVVDSISRYKTTRQQKET
jgi:transcription-repair coupling factor (superfamily II helicase)